LCDPVKKDIFIPFCMARKGAEAPRHRRHPVFCAHGSTPKGQNAIIVLPKTKDGYF
jgi:hypothetical protein